MGTFAWSSRLLAVAFACVIVTDSHAAGVRATAADPDREVVGRPVEGALGIEESVAAIMEREARFPSMLRAPRRWTKHILRREPLPLTGAPEVSSWPIVEPGAAQPYNPVPLAPQTVSTPNFTAATLADTSAFPPDTMGTVGPTQFIVAVNGRFRSFNKLTGVADGALNVNPTTFFASVLTPVGGAVASVFTSDPRIRYDRLSGRWYIVMIDVPINASQVPQPNRVLLAVSSGPTITSAASFTFFQFQVSATNFADYPTLGIDANALYIGLNMFSVPGSSFVGTDAAVVRKSSVLGAGPIVSTVFTGLVAGAGAGPFTPQGVDNFDPAATEGYFIGVDNALFSQLDVRRVTNPAGTPALSGNLVITVPTTTFPNPVTHLGNTGGLNGRLDSLDDRLYAAHLRNGRLWTAHNIRVSAAGVASTATEARNAVRWYEIGNLTTSPSLVQSGTVFDNAATLAAAQQYWIPSVMVSGQGHAALGFSAAGTNFRVDAATVGRLAGDTLGTTQGTPVRYTASSAAYNPPGDSGGGSGRRWGDYSYTSVDPCDDQTMWTIQQFTDATNSYGVRAVRLLAPAPTISCGASTPLAQGGTANVTVSGTGLFNTAPGIDACRIAASASVGGAGVSVTGVTVDSPTQATIALAATAGAAIGARTLSFRNPDNQETTANGCVTVTGSATVSSIVLAQPSPACTGPNVSWNVSFSTAVTGLSVSNFALAGSAVGASIGSVTGSGAAWTVTANPGTTSGTLRLDLVNSTGVTPTLSGLPVAGATYTINATPAAFAVSGGGSYCSGGAGVAVGLAGSAIGVNYQLFRGATPVGSAVPGTGSALAFGNQTVGGSYTVAATSATSSCTASMTGSATVTVNPTPTVFNVTGGGAYCSGGAGVAVGLSGSASGVNYQLFRDATPVGSAVPGTGAALAFGNQTVAGSYTVVATNASTTCPSNMSGAAAVSVNPSPPTFNVVGGGSYCNGGAGVAVGLSGSTSGVNYQLFRGATPVGSAVPGTGSALAFGNQTVGGSYTVIATNATSSCTTSMTGSATVTVNPTPTVFNVTGGGAYCSGGAGVAVGLSGSASGVNYQLFRDATPIGSPVPGTGAALAFGNQTTAGSYTVSASGSNGCTAGMSGASAVSVSPLPVVNAGTPAAICTGATTAIPLTSTPAGASFTWTAASAGGSVTGFSGGSGTNIAQVLTGAGSVDYVVSASLAGCASASTRTFTQPVSGPQVVQTTLPAAVQSFAYGQQLTATGVLGSATFSRTVGALPAGLALSPAGLIDGTPTAVGPSTFTIAVADSAVAGCSGSRSLGIEVRANQVFVDGFEGP